MEEETIALIGQEEAAALVTRNPTHTAEYWAAVKLNLSGWIAWLVTL